MKFNNPMNKVIVGLLVLVLFFLIVNLWQTGQFYKELKQIAPGVQLVLDEIKALDSTIASYIKAMEREKLNFIAINNNVRNIFEEIQIIDGLCIKIGKDLEYLNCPTEATRILMSHLQGILAHAYFQLYLSDLQMSNLVDETKRREVLKDKEQSLDRLKSRIKDMNQTMSEVFWPYSKIKFIF